MMLNNTTSIGKNIFSQEHTRIDFITIAKIYLGKFIGIHLAWLSRWLRRERYIKRRRKECSYPKIGCVHAEILFECARKIKSLKITSAKWLGSFSSELIVDGRCSSRICIFSKIDGTIWSMYLQASFCNSSLAVFRMNAWWPRRPNERNLSTKENDREWMWAKYFDWFWSGV